jgi:hypothetical protein
MSIFPQVGDFIFDHAHGKGVVTKSFESYGYFHVEYRQGVSRIHSLKLDSIKRTGPGWEILDRVIAGRKVEGYVEILEYRHKDGNVKSLTKPFYTTKSGRLRFSYGYGVNKNGLNPKSLGVTHRQHNCTVMYVLSNDPLRDRWKSVFWRSLVKRKDIQLRSA